MLRIVRSGSIDIYIYNGGNLNSISVYNSSFLDVPALETLKQRHSTYITTIHTKYNIFIVIELTVYLYV